MALCSPPSPPSPPQRGLNSEDAAERVTHGLVDHARQQQQLARGWAGVLHLCGGARAESGAPPAARACFGQLRCSPAHEPQSHQRSLWRWAEGTQQAHLCQVLQQAGAEQRRAMAVGLKVDPHVKRMRLRVQVLHACSSAVGGARQRQRH